MTTTPQEPAPGSADKPILNDRDEAEAIKDDAEQDEAAQDDRA